MMPERQIQGAEKFLDREVFTSDGESVGVAAKLLNNRVSGIPEWILVEAGLFGIDKHIVPIAGVELHDDHITIPYTNDVVKAEPKAAPDEETGTLLPEADDALNRHFGLGANGG